MKKRKREFTLDELLPRITRGTGYKNAEKTAQIRSFLEKYLDSSLLEEIRQIEYQNDVLTLRISSPLLKEDFRLRKQFFLTKFQTQPGFSTLRELRIL